MAIEPISTSTAAVATLAASAVAVPALTLLGYPLGIRPEVLFAGFGGGCFGVTLLNTVPHEPHLDWPLWASALWTAARRIVAIIVSSIAAGYIAPSLAAGAPFDVQLMTALVIGAGAQGAVTMVLIKLGIQKLDAPATPTPKKEGTP